MLSTAFDLKADHCRATCPLASFPRSQGEYQIYLAPGVGGEANLFLEIVGTALPILSILLFLYLFLKVSGSKPGKLKKQCLTGIQTVRSCMRKSTKDGDAAEDKEQKPKRGWCARLFTRKAANGQDEGQEGDEEKTKGADKGGGVLLEEVRNRYVGWEGVGRARAPC